MVYTSCHRALHAEHVYFFGQGKMQIIDCIEFNQRFRFVDVASVAAFPAMALICSLICSG
jgi:hypothetical protein